MDIKRIKFERTGGFAGIRLAAEFDLNDLPQDQADQLKNLINNLQFDQLPATLQKGQAIPDGFTYSITVNQHSVTTTDGSIPEKMQPLLDTLTQVARQRMTKK
jgi:hypothetical protein